MADRARRGSDDPGSPEHLEAARRGDRRAIEAILREHAGQVHAICNRLCRDRQDAEDAAQEALLSVARGLAGFDGRSRLSSWIYRVTTNACMDELRRKRRRPDPADPTPLAERAADPTPSHSPECAALAMQTREELAAALELLPEEFRVAVVLRDVVDLDYATIAETTGVAVGTVRSRIARGRGRLADILVAGTDPHSAASKDPADEPDPSATDPSNAADPDR